MSYILDALSKSERERKGRAIPGIDAHPLTGVVRARPIWPVAVGLLALIALNGGALLWWYSQPQERLDEPVTAAQEPDRKPAVPDAIDSPQPERREQVVAADFSLPSNPDARPAAEEEAVLITPGDFARQQQARSAASNATNSVADSPITISALPASVRNTLPDLVFSSHIFSGDPTFRLVNINGQSLREGENVDENVVLQEITEEGVILSAQGYVFEVSVLRDWSSN